MDKKTIDTYNATFHEYEKKIAPFWDLFPCKIVDTFTSTVTSGGKILDVGSGTGRDGLTFKNKGLDVVCLDASEEMVRLSKQKGLQSIIGDFMHLPFEDATFDGVWAYTSLLHVSKREVGKAIFEISRVLKPGGVFGLGLIEGDDEYYRTSAGQDSARWFSFYTKEEVEFLLSKNGFTLLFFEKITPGTKDYLHFIARKSSFL